ncbi:MAG: ComEC/Rec2 family competence protein [Prevotella sp.]|nr:ComEC/Rec2 family competence protein [Prevotella sp.]
MRPSDSIFQRAPLLRMVIMLILGIFVGDSVGYSLPLWVWLVISLAFWAIYLILRVLRKRKSIFQCVFSVFYGFLVLVVCFLLGFFLISSEKRQLECHFPTEKVAFDAVVVSEPVVRGKVIQCELMAIRQGKKPFRLRASILRDTLHRRYERLRFGDGIHTYAKIEKPQAFSSQNQQFGFDFLRWLQVHGVVGQTFIFHSDWQKAAVSLQPLSVVERTKIRLMRFRRKGVEALRASGLDGHEQAVVAAMVLGDKSALTKELRETYSVSGASHVLALSGLHLGIIYFLLSFIFVRMGWRVAGQLFTLPVIWLFALMVGFSPSVVRASTMLTVYGIVALLGRSAFSLNTLSLAALVMLLFSPLSLWDVGFQLSFMAVLGIIVFYPMFNKAFLWFFDMILSRKIKNNRLFKTILEWILGLAAVSCATQVTTAPLVAYYFGRFPVYFLVTNFVAIPLVTLILYTAAVFFLAVAVESLIGASLLTIKSTLASVLYELSSLLNKGLEGIASWPCSSIENIRLSSLQTALLYLLIVLVCAIVIRARKIHRDLQLTKYR